ncbi:MAG TPA: MgtC/SapB family protein [Ktedonobacterales bacterium]|nr:MgtC/SapB family protein [Ktedonobacterales bacterium]
MISIGEEVIRLLVAALLGSAIGLERERLARGAGLRTHALVATASALVILVSSYGFQDVIEPGRVVLDPSRVAAQVVSGIGFLGAGTIILRKNVVRGLTTAASIWAVAAIGLASGAGLYSAAVATTAILLGILVALRSVERRLFTHKRAWLLTVHAERRPGLVAELEAGAEAAHLDVQRLHLESGPGPGTSTIRLELSGPGAGGGLAHFAEQAQQLPGVRSVTYHGRQLAAHEAGVGAAEDEEGDEDEGLHEE